MGRNNNLFLGSVLIILGIMVFLNKIAIPGFQIFSPGFLLSNFWALLFVIIPGLAFHYKYFTGQGKDPGLLVPGGILLVVGCILQISHLFNAWELLWPGFILSVAVGLFELYIFGTREKGLLIPVFILGGLSIVFFSMTIGWWVSYSLGKYFLPVVLIGVGIIVMFGSKQK